MLIVERPLTVACGMTSTFGWSSLSDGCPGGHWATVDLGCNERRGIGQAIVAWHWW